MPKRTQIAHFLHELVPKCHRQPQTLAVVEMNLGEPWAQLTNQVHIPRLAQTWLLSLSLIQIVVIRRYCHGL